MIAMVEKVFVWDRGWCKQPRVQFQFDGGSMPIHYSCDEMGHPKEFWEKLVGKKVKATTIVKVEIV